MWWYVYLISIPVAAFLSQIAVELIGRPTRTVLSLRQQALERMLAFRDLSLPRPREAAVSSRQIREHDQAVRNLREAQRTLDDLGAQLLAFNESELTVCSLMALCGLDIVLAGHELIHLSRVYATAKIDSDVLRHSIEEAHQTIGRALAMSRRHSGEDLIKIRTSRSTYAIRVIDRDRSAGRAWSLVVPHFALDPRQAGLQDSRVRCFGMAMCLLYPQAV
jgi:hypothetical protein